MRKLTIPFLFFALFLVQIGFADVFEYSLNGQPVAIVNALGRKTALEYDSVGRLAKILYTNGKIVSYRYDENNNRIEMEDAHGITKFTYDDLDRVISVAYPGLSPLLYAYNDANQIVSMKYPDGDSISYQYDDSDGRLQSVCSKAGTVKFFYHNGCSIPSKILYPNAICTEYLYDIAKRVTDVIHRDSKDSLILSYHYQYDSNSNCIFMEANSVKGNKIVRYFYDKLDRLIEASYSDGTFEKYTYDGFSNRIAKETERGKEIYSYDENNRLIQKGDVYFYYNELGNLTKKECGRDVVEYFYDDNNYLIEVTNPDHHVTFVYDGDGKRIYKTVDGVTTRYINDVGGISQVIAEANVDNNIIAQYFFADRRFCRCNAEQGSEFYLYDHPAKNVSALVNQQGESCFYSYDPFGVVTACPDTSSNNFQYVGEQFDKETGLIYLRNRYYDPEMGRFITSDPHKGSLLNPHSWNPYIYVLNNPLKYVDPLGLNALTIISYPPGTITDDGVSITGHACVIHTRFDGSQMVMGKYGTWNLFKRRISPYDKIYPGSVTYTWDISPEVGDAIEREFGQKGFYLLFKNNCTDAVVEMVQKYIDPTFASKKTFGIHNPTDLMQAIAEKKGEKCAYLDQLNKEKNEIWENYESDALAPTSHGVRYFLKHFLGASDRGGISLCKTADLMVNLEEIIGSVFDERTGQLILIGKKNYHLPHLDPDDFAVAVRSVFGLGSKPPEDPGISIDPYPMNGVPEIMKVRYDGETKNTAFGNILFEADKLLKNLSLGRENLTGKKFKSHVKGYKSLPIRYDEEGHPPQEDLYTRLWFVPSEICVIQSPDHSMQFEKVKMQVLSEATYHNKTSYNFSAENFARHMTEHYQEFAEEFPILQELERLGQITGVVKWIKDNQVPFDLSLFKNYQPRFAPTPENTSVTGAVFGGCRHFVFGGVNYKLGPHNYAQTTSGALGFMKEMALQSRPADTEFMWEFYDGNTPYLAVAETIYRTPKAGNIKKTFLDMHFPVAGAHPLMLARTYNSFEEEESGFGKGWSALPAQLKFPMPKTFLSNQTEQLEGYFTILVKDEEGENIYIAKEYYPEYLLYKSDQASAMLRAYTDGTFVLLKQDNSTWTFDQEGRLITTQDKIGFEIHYQYEGPHLTRIQHQNGSCIELIYQEDRVVETIGLGGKTFYYAYDACKQLQSVSDTMGPLYSFAYDGEKRLTMIYDAAATVLFSAHYDIYGRATTLIDGPLSYSQAFDISSGLTACTKDDFKNTQSIDSLCRLTKLEDSFHRTMQMHYEENSLFPSSIQDPLGHTTQYTCDTKGRLASITRADESTKKFWYDQKDRLTLSQDGKGSYTLTRYDDQDRVILQASACQIEFTEEGANYDTSKGQTITFTYQDSDLKPSSISSSHQRPHQFAYYPNGQLAKAYFPEGKELRFEYDARCRLCRVYENGVLSLEYSHNERDLITSTTTPYGKTTYERDIHGNIITLIDAKNNKTFFEYDAYHRLIQITDAEGGLTTYAYDASSRLQEIVFPGGSKRLFSYDAAHRLKEELVH